MTASDQNAPAPTTDNDPSDLAPGNVSPPKGLSASRGDQAQDGEAPSEGDGDAAPTGDDVLGHS